MSVEITRQISDYNHTSYTNRRIAGIVMHYVGAVSTAKNNADYFCGGDRDASAHYFIDRNDCYQVVDEQNGAWHCGGGPYSQGSGGSSWGSTLGNRNTIGIEMCCEDIEGKCCVPWDVIKRAGELVRELIARYGIDPAAVVRHYDITGKDCPEWVQLEDGHAYSGTDDDVWFSVWSELIGGTPVPVPDKPEEHEAEPTPEAPSDGKLEVDGYFGPLTIRALQHALGTIEDGYVSGQLKTNMDSIGGRPHTAWLIGTGGSAMVKALQRKVGASIDGRFGPLTCRLLQRYLGTPVDGIIDKPSPMVKELQRRLNAGTF